MGDTESSDPANGILSGRAPYGLLVVETEPGRRVLQADPSTARIVSRIFHEYLDGRGLLAIAEGLTADGVPCPAARYCRTNEVGTAWSKGSVRSILINERYAGATGTQQSASDELLANAVYAKLNADPNYYLRHVDVRLHNGVAQLSGYVWSTDAIYAARRIARSVPGVTCVATTQLELERNGRSDGVAR